MHFSRGCSLSDIVVFGKCSHNSITLAMAMHNNHPRTHIDRVTVKGPISKKPLSINTPHENAWLDHLEVGRIMASKTNVAARFFTDE